MTAKRGRLVEKYFYFVMSLLVAVVVVYGFSHTMGANLIHPTVPRPRLLYFHAVIFFGWLVFFIVQSGLVRTRNVRLHRTLGWFGVALGITILVLGVSTAITMTRFKIAELHSTTAAMDMIIPMWDMIAFAVTFTLAIYWRKRPEYHRRMMLVATCVLTAAGFGRYPIGLAYNYFYGGVDLLILLGVARDLMVNRRVHPVYLYVLPLFVFFQSVVIYTDNHRLPYWVSIADAILK
jgi:tryptophan-rich sensory protein